MARSRKRKPTGRRPKAAQPQSPLGDESLDLIALADREMPRSEEVARALEDLLDAMSVDPTSIEAFQIMSMVAQVAWNSTLISAAEAKLKTESLAGSLEPGIPPEVTRMLVRALMRLKRERYPNLMHPIALQAMDMVDGRMRVTAWVNPNPDKRSSPSVAVEPPVRPKWIVESDDDFAITAPLMVHGDPLVRALVRAQSQPDDDLSAALLRVISFGAAPVVTRDHFELRATLGAMAWNACVVLPGREREFIERWAAHDSPLDAEQQLDMMQLFCNEKLRLYPDDLRRIAEVAVTWDGDNPTVHATRHDTAGPAPARILSKEPQDNPMNAENVERLHALGLMDGFGKRAAPDLARLIEDIVRPVLEEEKSRERLESLVGAAVLGWNLGLMPPDREEEAREAFLDTRDGEDVTFLRALLQSVAEHKRAKYPDDERFIIDVKVRETDGGFAVDVWVPEYFDDN